MAEAIPPKWRRNPRNASQRRGTSGPASGPSDAIVCSGRGPLDGPDWANTTMQPVSYEENSSALDSNTASQVAGTVKKKGKNRNRNKAKRAAVPEMAAADHPARGKGRQRRDHPSLPPKPNFVPNDQEMPRSFDRRDGSSSQSSDYTHKSSGWTTLHQRGPQISMSGTAQNPYAFPGFPFVGSHYGGINAPQGQSQLPFHPFTGRVSSSGWQAINSQMAHPSGGVRLQPPGMAMFNNMMPNPQMSGFMANPSTMFPMNPGVPLPHMSAAMLQHEPDDFRGFPGGVKRDVLGTMQRKIPPPEFPNLRPSPTDSYLVQSASNPVHLAGPQPLLIITDLNGTLIYRGRSGKQSFVPRPHLDEFLSLLLFDQSFSTMVWSSARPENVTAILTKLFTKKQRAKLVAEWARDKLGLNNRQYNQKVQVYKRLTAVWRDPDIQRTHPRADRGEEWGPHNTVLIDDSKEKARSEPYNLICIPEFVVEKKVEGKSEAEAEERVLMKVMEYLNEAKYWSNVSAFIRERPFAMEDAE